MNRTKIFESWIKLMAWTMPHGSLQRISNVYQSISDSILQIRLLYPRFWTVNYMTSNVRLNAISGRWIAEFNASFFTDFWMNDIGYHCFVSIGLYMFLLRWWMWYAYRLSPVLRLVDPSGFQVQYSHQRNHVTRSAKAVPRLIYVTIIPKWLSISSHIRTKLTSLEITLLLLIDFS